jgi:hypothetical protein
MRAARVTLVQLPVRGSLTRILHDFERRHQPGVDCRSINTRQLPRAHRRSDQSCT